MEITRTGDLMYFKEKLTFNLEVTSAVHNCGVNVIGGVAEYQGSYVELLKKYLLISMIMQNKYYCLCTDNLCNHNLYRSYALSGIISDSFEFNNPNGSDCICYMVSLDEYEDKYIYNVLKELIERGTYKIVTSNKNEYNYEFKSGGKHNQYYFNSYFKEILENYDKQES